MSDTHIFDNLLDLFSFSALRNQRIDNFMERLTFRNYLILSKIRAFFAPLIFTPSLFVPPDPALRVCVEGATPPEPVLVGKFATSVGKMVKLPRGVFR